MSTVFLLGIFLKQFEEIHQHFQLFGSPIQFLQITALPGSTTVTDYLWIYSFHEICMEQAWQYPTAA